MPPSAIYTFGYGSRTVETFESLLDAMDGLIVDIRYKPHNARPGWSQEELLARFPLQYQWFEEWGNKNYWARRFDSNAPIVLADFEAGLLRFERLPDQPVVLLCGCRNNHCHRFHVADRLRERGYEVKELAWPKRKAAPKPPSKILKLTP